MTSVVAQTSSEQQAVDLSSIKPKYSTNSKSTLKNVLTEYGLPEQEQPKRERPKKTKKKHQEEEYWSETDQERQKAKQDHYLQIYEDVYKLKDLYYAKYMNALRKHVDKQREDIQKKSVKLQQNMEIKQAKEAENKAKVRQRMQKYQIGHDAEYLKNIPKSDYYKITELIAQKQKDGELRTQSELDEFWSQIRKPHVFRRYFPPPVSGTVTGSLTSSVAPMRSRSSTLDSLPAQPPSHPPGYRPMTHISEQREPSSRGLSEPRESREAAPPAYQHKKSTKKQDPYSIARQAAQDLDKRFPRMELPPLNCFTSEIGEKPPDPEEVLREMSAKQRERERRTYVRKLRRMYQLALSNTASAQRILDKHGDDEVGLLEPSIRELTIEWPDREDTTDTLEIEPPWTKYLSRRQMVPIAEVSEHATPARTPGSRKSRQRKGLSSQSSTKSDSDLPRMLEPPQYLTLGSMASGSRIVEPKVPSTMWTNYAKAEKPFFLTEEAESDQVSFA